MTRIQMIVAMMLVGALGVTQSSPTSAQGLLFVTGAGDVVVNDSSYDLISRDQFMSPDFISGQVELIPQLYAGLEYSASSEMMELEGMSTTFQTTGVMAVARLEYELTPWLIPYLQLGVGGFHAEMKLSVYGNSPLEQSVWVPGAVQLGGLELMVPRTFLRRILSVESGSAFWDFTLGLSLEMGYQTAGLIEFDALERPTPDQKPKPEDTMLPIAKLDYGQVDMSGMTLRFGLNVHF